MGCFRVFISLAILFFAVLIGIVYYENQYSNVDVVRNGIKAKIFATMLSNMQGQMQAILEPQKTSLLKDLEGTVAEIGSGTGGNFKFFGNKIKKLIAVEPNLEMFPYMRDAAKDLPPNVELIIEPGIAQNLTFSDNSLDAVVLMHVLCTINALDEAMIEMKRVLKPDGKLVFLEHIGDPVKDSWRRSFQNWLRPVWKVIGEGCEPNRDTLDLIEKHFTIEQYEYFEIPIKIPIIQPHIMGFAKKN